MEVSLDCALIDPDWPRSGTLVISMPDLAPGAARNDSPIYGKLEIHALESVVVLPCGFLTFEVRHFLAQLSALREGRAARARLASVENASWLEVVRLDENLAAFGVSGEFHCAGSTVYVRGEEPGIKPDVLHFKFAFGGMGLDERGVDKLVEGLKQVFAAE